MFAFCLIAASFSPPLLSAVVFPVLYRVLVAIVWFLSIVNVYFNYNLYRALLSALSSVSVDLVSLLPSGVGSGWLAGVIMALSLPYLS